MVKALAVRLYSEGLSLRRDSEVLSEMGFHVSHESVRLWFHRAGDMLSSILARRAYLWATREIIAIQVSRGRVWVECMKFMEAVGDSCANKQTIYADRAG